MEAAFVGLPGDGAQIELFEYRGIERHSATAREEDPAASRLVLRVVDPEGVRERLGGDRDPQGRPRVLPRTDIRWCSSQADDPHLELGQLGVEDDSRDALMQAEDGLSLAVRPGRTMGGWVAVLGCAAASGRGRRRRSQPPGWQRAGAVLPGDPGMVFTATPAQRSTRPAFPRFLVLIT